VEFAGKQTENSLKVSNLNNKSLFLKQNVINYVNFLGGACLCIY
jgi:hypothetical protein